MNYSEIKFNDIANGAGVRTSLFVSGCRHRCDGCFNSVAWSFDAGSPFTMRTLIDVLKSLDSPYVNGISVLGGEPLEPENQWDVWNILYTVLYPHPEKDTWMWTGFTWEELMGNGCRACSDPEMLRRVLRLVDVLVDGPFVKELYDPMLRFRGSSNQRIIDVPKTLESGEVCLWDDGNTRGRW